MTAPAAATANPATRGRAGRDPAARDAAASTLVTADDVRAALTEVEDPELAISLVDLGLIRSVTVQTTPQGVAVHVGITFTTIACPCNDVIREDIETRLLRLGGVTRVEVEDLFEPWSRDDMTEDGRLALLGLGIT